ncbi:double-strand break repair helicase AddA [Lutibaculum baratangense]|uniref:DNA 3'-5' helicase n=1 Tax=Lutibaculum baratangense AMV1 TaxID=631454 RepID=V4RIT6_9HYPH|nr:double-strand break repair helicase AddA [Lutibaculum baratangense]ESR26001.1 ATP-dependent nuclease subunit A [Lutibaculum baratangense AMV1]
MAEKLSIPDHVKHRQRQASGPDASAWVRANAGAGKTHVLTQRVLRLLLAGAEPSKIVCITYTKAAAAEMSNRVFERLAAWATAGDEELSRNLQEIEGRPVKPRELKRARQLFAAAVETPGGLKVQTIHAFCERLLQQFPFEASVPPGFEVLDERAQAELLIEARTAVFRALGDDGPVRRAIARLSARAADQTFEALLAEAVARRFELRAWLIEAGERDEDATSDLAAAMARLRRELGLGPCETEASILAEILDRADPARAAWQGVADTLIAAGGKMAPLGVHLAKACCAPDDEACFEAYRNVFLTGGGEPRKNPITKAFRSEHPELAERLEAEIGRVCPLVERLSIARMAEDTEALFTLADAVIARYEALKAAGGRMDFDDLVRRAADLVTRADTTWVLFKLDGGIDHILVDEAQDTSPMQWRVIGSLAEEFFADKGAREAGRTVFAVGDEKQSIYSFQGADPTGFKAMETTFSKRAEGAGQTWHPVRLDLSFRSAPAVLETVDRVFGPPKGGGEGLRFGAEHQPHEAIRASAPGLVEIWEPVPPPAVPDQSPWDAPLDAERADSPAATLAARIARTIRRFIDEKEPLESTGRPVRPSDVMILVSRRDPFSANMIRALKAQNIPVAGADRLVLTSHIAVMDLMALGRFVSLPEDDLTLACLLKSPLLGLSEEELMDLAAGRGGTLWGALQARSAESPRLASVRARLAEWRARAGYERPFEFYARILGPDRGREAFHGRLGSEAFEAIDEFLSLALAYEQGHTPSLPGFLRWLDLAPAEIKRDLDQGRDEVRVMTVHGAKGLEAPIVFLPDTCTLPREQRVGPIFQTPEGCLVWAPSKKADAPLTAVLREAGVARQMEEHRRLLYVAMTRARDRLYVAGYVGAKGRPEACWHALVDAALPEEIAPQVETPEGPARRYRSGEARSAEAGKPAPARAEAPGWLHRPAPAESAARTVQPSRLVPHRGFAADAAAAEARAAALQRGTALHRLLESLPEAPPEHRRSRGARALGLLLPGLPEERRDALLAEVMAILDDPRFAEAFGPDSRAEVSLGGEVAGVGDRFSAQIDRMAVTDGRVLIVDYKSDRAVPASIGEAPAAYLAQLAAYRQLARQIYPEKVVEAAILWTAAPRLDPVPTDLLAPHGGPASLDAAGPHP